STPPPFLDSQVLCETSHTSMQAGSQPNAAPESALGKIAVSPPPSLPSRSSDIFHAPWLPLHLHSGFQEENSGSHRRVRSSPRTPRLPSNVTMKHGGGAAAVVSSNAHPTWARSPLRRRRAGLAARTPNPESGWSGKAPVPRSPHRRGFRP